MRLKNYYQFDDQTGIWKRSDEQAFNYSDGDSVENELFEAILCADDRSVFSEDLRRLQATWPFTYHLSSSRANLLRPFEQTLLKGARVLELGCGCGAVTRYLGETVAEVVAVDGSARRASIAAARCHGLKSVTIVSDTVAQLPREIGLFDVVTLIGVLEYGHVFGNGTDPVLELLNKARSFLKPGGALVLAIENKLGLKYLAGVPEDHLGTPWTGVVNAYAEKGVRTWSRSEIIGFLTASGYTSISQFVPIPDYKLPTTIISPAGLEPDCDFKQAPLLALRTRIFEEQPLFNTMQAWESVCAAKLLPELADSLCFVALTEEKATTAVWPEAVLAYHYGGDCVPKFAAKEMLIERAEGGLRVRRRRLFNGMEPVKGGGISHRLDDEPYLPGELLFVKCRNVVTRPGWTSAMLADALRPWWDWLVGHAITADGSLVDGGLIDATPFNIMQDDNGCLTFFSREWSLETPVSPAAVLLRGLFATYRMLGPVAAPASGTPIEFWLLVEEICRCLGLPHSRRELENALREGMCLEGLVFRTKTFVLSGINSLKLQIMLPPTRQLQDELIHLRHEVKNLGSVCPAISNSFSLFCTKAFLSGSHYVRKISNIVRKISGKVVRIVGIAKNEGIINAVKEIVRVLIRVWNRFFRLYQRFVERRLIPFPKLLPVTAPQPHSADSSLRGAKLSAATKGECLFGTGFDFSDTRTVVIAYSCHPGFGDSPAVYARRHFKQIGYHIVAVFDGRDCEGITFSHCDAAISYEHADSFQGWKSALTTFPSLFACKELILCDDSVYAGLFSHVPMHKAMNRLDCDFWGVVESTEKQGELQNWYLVFKPPALQHKAFFTFFDTYSASEVPKGEPKKDTLTAALSKQGLRPGVFAPTPPEFRGQDLMHALWRPLLARGAPFISRQLLISGWNHGVDTSDWPQSLRERGYPVEIIFRHYIQLEQDITVSACPGKRSRVWPPDVFAMQRAVQLESKSLISSPQASGESVGAFVHVYYLDELPELAGYLQNLPSETRLHVSTDTEEKAGAINGILNSFGFTDPEIRVLPNNGFDIAPFFVGFADRLDAYSYLVKVHAKKSSHLRLAGDSPEKLSQEWRYLLYTSLLGSRRRIGQILDFLRNNSDMGMLAPPSLPHHVFHGLVSQAANHHFMRRLLAPYDIALTPDTAIDFPMGTMFWCRPEALKPWTGMGLRFEDFKEGTSPDKRDGSLAHALERLIFFGCAIQGLHWGRVFPAERDW